MVKTVLVVDDEPIVREVVVRYLEREGYRTLEAGDGDAARDALARTSPDLVVLDVMLPGTDGLELCRWIRSTSAASGDHAHGPRRGGRSNRRARTRCGRLRDEAVLAARARRPSQERPTAVRSCRRVAGPPGRSATSSSNAPRARYARRGIELRLTAKEFDLLWFLASHPRRVFSRDQLMARVWGYTAALDTGTVTVHVRRLREKLEDDPSQPRYLETVWGIGYRLAA